MFLQKLAENSNCIMRHNAKKTYFLLKVCSTLFPFSFFLFLPSKAVYVFQKGKIIEYKVLF